MSNDPTPPPAATSAPSTTATPSLSSEKLNTGPSGAWREKRTPLPTKSSAILEQSQELDNNATLRFPTTEAALASAAEYLKGKGFCPQGKCDLPALLPPDPDAAPYRAVEAYANYQNLPGEKFVHEVFLPSFEEYVRSERVETKVTALKRKGVEFIREPTAEEVYYGAVVHELSHTLGRKELGAENPRWESEAFQTELEFYKSRGMIKNISQDHILNIIRDYPPERSGRELGHMIAETLDKEPASDLKEYSKYIPYSNSWKEYIESEQHRVKKDLETLPSSEEAKKDRQDQLLLYTEWLDPFGAEAVQGHIKKGIESYLVDKKQAQPRTPELYKQVDEWYEKIRSRGILNELEQTVSENA